MRKDTKESLCSCMYFYLAYTCVCSCVCVSQLYTQLTVIQDDPDFPRLTLSVSQLSLSNLSFSICHTQINIQVLLYSKSRNTW